MVILIILLILRLNEHYNPPIPQNLYDFPEKIYFDYKNNDKFFYKFFIKLALYCFKHLHTRKSIAIIIYITNIIPKIIFLVSVTIDILIYNHIYYIYIFSIFIIIALIETCFYYILEIFCFLKIKELDQVFIFINTKK